MGGRRMVKLSSGLRKFELLWGKCFRTFLDGCLVYLGEEVSGLVMCCCCPSGAELETFLEEELSGALASLLADSILGGPLGVPMQLFYGVYYSAFGKCELVEAVVRLVGS